MLRLHLTLFLTTALLHAPASVSSQHLSAASLDQLLETRQLGATAGKELGLENALRWREVVGANGEPTGLFKSRGSMVEALVGAVYMKHVRASPFPCGRKRWLTLLGNTGH